MEVLKCDPCFLLLLVMDEITQVDKNLKLK